MLAFLGTLSNKLSNPSNQKSLDLVRAVYVFVERCDCDAPLHVVGWPMECLVRFSSAWMFSIP